MSGEVILLSLVLLGIIFRMFQLITSSPHQLFSNCTNLCDTGTVYIYTVDSTFAVTSYTCKSRTEIYVVGWKTTKWACQHETFTA